MAEHVLSVEQAADWKPGFPRLPVVTARDYLGGGETFSPKRRLHVINLCRGYRYLSIGYYCSLLAEARGHNVVPSVRTLQELSSRGIYGLVTDELNQRVQRLLGKRRGGATLTAYELTIFFGHCATRELQPLAREIFETFRCAALRVELKHSGTGLGSWRIAAIRALTLDGLNADSTGALASSDGGRFMPASTS